MGVICIGRKISNQNLHETFSMGRVIGVTGIDID